MSEHIIWLHEKALGMDHPAFRHTDADTNIIHIWDDCYYKSRSYTLKRLVFIYETLCELPVDIIHGNIVEVMRSLCPKSITVPYTADIDIRSLCDELSHIADVRIIKDTPFVEIPDDTEYKRFFKYWNQAKKTAFLIGGKNEEEN